MVHCAEHSIIASPHFPPFRKRSVRCCLHCGLVKLISNLAMSCLLWLTQVVFAIRVVGFEFSVGRGFVVPACMVLKSFERGGGRSGGSAQAALRHQKANT